MIRATRRPTPEATVDSPLLDACFAARADSDDWAFIDGERRLTWRTLEEKVSQVANGLRALGVVEGQAVCWQLPNQLEAVIVHLAALRVGAVSTPIVPIYRHREVEFILRQSAAPVIVTARRFRGFDFSAMMRELRHALPDLEHVVVVGEAEPDDISFDALLIAENDEPATVDARTPDSVAALLYTSGTTGEPKGVLHTHRTLGHEIASFARFFSLRCGDVVLMPSPLTHITGLVFGIHLPAELGSGTVLQSVWNPCRAWELIERHGCRVLVGATPFLHGLLQEARTDGSRPRLGLFACGGADVPAELIERAGEELGCLVVRGYGSTELPTATACNGADPVVMRATTDGRVIESVQIRVVTTNGGPTSPRCEGAVEVRGPELFVGYLDASLNEAAFTTDGWFRTGDLGVIDDAGYLTITGRIKDVIIRGGENLSAHEIESFVAQHHDVVDVAVVGMPDPVLVERVCAFVVLVAGSTLDVDDLVEFLADFRVASQKLPERLEIVGELPRTASGKVQKHLLRKQITDRLAAEKTAAPKIDERAHS